MTQKPAATEAKIIVAIIALFASFLAGWTVQSWRLGAQISQIETDAQKRYSQAATENINKLVTAKKMSDVLVARVAGLENTIYLFAEEKNREIKKLTTGRPCLGSAAVRLLNAGPAGIRIGGPVPEAAGIALPTAAGSTTDPDSEGYATDTDIAAWINQAQRSYDICRAYIKAIADFYEGQP